MARVPRLRVGKGTTEEAPAVEEEAVEEPFVEQEPIAISGGAGREDNDRVRQLHGLAVLSLFLQSAGSIDEMVSRLLEQTPDVTGAIFAYPLLLDRKRQLLRASMLEGCTDARLEAAMDAFQEDLTALEFSLLQNGDLHRILDEGEVVLRDGFETLFNDTLPKEQWKEAEKTLGIRKLALAPMVVENEPLGLVAFAYNRSDVDVETLELLVGHLTLALRDILVRDEAVRFSDVDPLTWVYNRRFLVQSLESELVRAGRYGRALSLVTLDIDGFSAFNNAYGQSLGDRLLRMVATTLAETVSPPEIVARLKDDDFAVLLPETNRAVAVTTTTRLLANLARLSVFGATGESEESVTVSVAIVSFPEDASTAQSLLERALGDLDMAKQERAQQQGGGEAPERPERAIDRVRHGRSA
jgi:diguanylate cyclase (GGDEF)-like protein